MAPKKGKKEKMETNQIGKAAQNSKPKKGTTNVSASKKVEQGSPDSQNKNVKKTTLEKPQKVKVEPKETLKQVNVESKVTSKQASVEAKKTPQPTAKENSQIKKNSVNPKKKMPRETASVSVSSVTTEPSAPPVLTKKVADKSISYSPKILVRESDTAPVYSLEDVQSEVKKPSFSKIIANENLLELLTKSSFSVPSKMLQETLPGAINGSDLLLFESEAQETFLIGVLPALAKILNQNSKVGLSALFICENPKKLEFIFNETTKIFSGLGLNFALLTEEKQSGELDLQKNPCNILFVSVEKLNELKNEGELSQISLIVVQDLNATKQKNNEALENLLLQLHKQEIQKILITSQNTPFIREFAFKYFEDPVCFSYLPVFVKENHPKQYAHALDSTQKFQVLLGYLKRFKPKCSLVVANTRSVAEWIAFKLHGNSIKVELIDVLPNFEKRAEISQAIKNSQSTVVVTTDKFIKNIGFKSLSCVYHFDLPDSPENYVERINKLENAQTTPLISTAFICEDYGFNMAKIEQILGFKVRVTFVDKNFFNYKDVSEYPLEEDGRVKRIASVEEMQVEQRKVLGAEARVSTKPIQSQVSAPVKEKIAASSEPPSEQSKATPVTSSAHVRSESVQPQHQQKTRPQTPPQSTHYQPDTSKFVRRDERAKEAVDAAVAAAKMARQRQEDSKDFDRNQKTDRHQDTSKRSTHEFVQGQKSQGLLSIAAAIVQDALLAAANAAKDSAKQNIEQNLPAFSKFLSKFKILGKNNSDKGNN